MCPRSCARSDNASLQTTRGRAQRNLSSFIHIDSVCVCATVRRHALGLAAHAPSISLWPLHRYQPCLGDRMRATLCCPHAPTRPSPNPCETESWRSWFARGRNRHRTPAGTPPPALPMVCRGVVPTSMPSSRRGQEVRPRSAHRPVARAISAAQNQLARGTRGGCGQMRLDLFLRLVLVGRKLRLRGDGVLPSLLRLLLGVWLGDHHRLELVERHLHGLQRSR